jgi:type IV secretion system protein VirB10
MPPLDARAPRPPVVRLRRGVVTGLVMSGAGLVAGALAWAFVVHPELRAQAHAARLEGREARALGTVRPSEVVTAAPATYAQLDRLPPPRRLGADPEAAAAGAPPSQSVPRRPSGRPSAAPRPPGIADDARASDLFFAPVRAGPGASGPSPSAAPAARAEAQGDYAAVYNTHGLLAPLTPFEVKAGAVVPAVLLTAVDTARAGPVVASVTEPVFDTVTGGHLLIPQGARLIGRHEGESRYGDRRAFLVWERLILPNGKSLVLTREPGVDAQGAMGVEGQVDRRLLPLAVATVFAGAITTLGQVARDGDRDGSGGLLGDAGDAAAIEAAQVGGRLIDRELEVRPSIRLKPGARVRVLVTRDLILEPYRR